MRIEPPPLEMTVQYAVDKAGLPGRALLRCWARAALAQKAQATLRLVGLDEGLRLNRDYRHKDYATNVLTFAYGGLPLSGDIVLCAPVLAREAAEQGKSLQAHYAHLVIHGMLHLQGYDHATAAEAAGMEAVESFVMMRLGFPDPYKHHE